MHKRHDLRVEHDQDAKFEYPGNRPDSEIAISVVSEDAADECQWLGGERQCVEEEDDARAVPVQLHFDLIELFWMNKLCCEF